MRSVVFPVAVAVFLIATVIGLSGGGWWTVPLLLIAGPIAMWTAPHDDPPVRPGFPADRWRQWEGDA